MTPPPRTILRMAWAMFYAGLIGLGMAGLGWTGFSAILAVLVLYTLVMRPVSHWAGARLFAVTLAVLAVASGVLWLVGLGLASLMWAPSPWLGMGLALAGLALARSVWGPQKEAELAAQLEARLAAAEAGPVAEPEPLDPRLQHLDGFLSELRVAARRPGGDPSDYVDDISALVREGLVEPALDGLAQIDSDLALGLRLEVIAHPDSGPSAGARIFEILGAVLDMDDVAGARALDLAERWLDNGGEAPDGAAPALAAGLAGLSPSHPLRPRAEALLHRLGGTPEPTHPDDPTP